MPHVGLYPKGSCSESTLRTAPPAGKEIFKANPIDTKFPFSSHWIGPWPANTEPKLMGQTVMADLDDDGDLDFAAGQRDTLPGGMYWWERCSDDHWVAHKVGAGQKPDSAGDALDVDKDGSIDIVSGDSWFKNCGDPEAVACSCRVVPASSTLPGSVLVGLALLAGWRVRRCWRQVENVVPRVTTRRRSSTSL